MEDFCRSDIFERSVKKARRIVVKVGSSALTRGNGMSTEVIEGLAGGLSFLMQQGKEVVLVSSGAVAAGRKKLGVPDRREISLQEKQALAAIGQSHLMYMYDLAFEHHGLTIAQLLLTHADLAHRDRYLNFKNTLFTLLSLGVLPVINENDTVSTEELQFGDNDNLAALVTNLIEGDLFICLSDVDGLYTDNPETNKDAKPLRVVSAVTDSVADMVCDGKSLLGTGGMQSKISAVEKVSAGGGFSIIACGREKNILQKIFAGDEVGTLFLPPSRKRLKGRKQWIAFVLKPKGVLQLDDGACAALLQGGKSLLPSGIQKVFGEFRVGEAVECRSEAGDVFAVGLVRYNSRDLERIVGHRSEEIMQILGFKGKTEIIHRDDLVVMSHT